jgi:hypothetical protein
MFNEGEDVSSGKSIGRICGLSEAAFGNVSDLVVTHESDPSEAGWPEGNRSDSSLSGDFGKKVLTGFPVLPDVA